MSAILDELIKSRRESAIAYEKLLAKYIKLVKNIENPENNTRYPESIRHRGALRTLYDNCGEDEELALALDKAVCNSKQADFRHNPFKERRIKKALLETLQSQTKSAGLMLADNREPYVASNDVEHIYNLVVEQAEY